LLDEWRSQSSNNEKNFREYCELWNLSENHFHKVIPDKEKVWMKIMSKISKPMSVKMYSRHFVYRAVGIAVFIALAIGFFPSHFIHKNKAASIVSFVTQPGQRAQVYLPDGTKVWLNSDTKLSYSTDYSLTNRNVKLNGEAFFDVVKDRYNQFNVSAGNYKVCVHGTAFNFKAYPDCSNFEVSLLRGRVSVFCLKNNALLANLLPNYKIVISPQNGGSHIQSCDARLESLWMEGEMRIEGANLYEVSKKMEKWYGVNIHTVKFKSDREYWMTIKTESLRETLELINKITPIDYIIKGKEVTITYK
jgi:ferric-dicitrate binding protein FerR (iron transport regulator)